ncbi:UBC core domain-containing protein [Caenorhabditis elegans]|uniref:UBC core domain-containing protein n=1 Tax=Caenorhabditis elegans TaxID=6239 RepID=Q9N3L6_CAEEL|nr:UBC core domain-containing protein [Caenorhabditis elegans]CCD70926.2 UBC core domain-containing protein [Caenorhabditis elegans]
MLNQEQNSIKKVRKNWKDHMYSSCATPRSSPTHFGDQVEGVQNLEECMDLDCSQEPQDWKEQTAKAQGLQFRRENNCSFKVTKQEIMDDQEEVAQPKKASFFENSDVFQSCSEASSRGGSEPVQLVSYLQNGSECLSSSEPRRLFLPACSDVKLNFSPLTTGPLMHQFPPGPEINKTWTTEEIGNFLKDHFKNTTTSKLEVDGLEIIAEFNPPTGPEDYPTFHVACQIWTGKYATGIFKNDVFDFRNYLFNPFSVDHSIPQIVIQSKSDSFYMNQMKKSHGPDYPKWSKLSKDAKKQWSTWRSQMYEVQKRQITDKLIVYRSVWEKMHGVEKPGRRCPMTLVKVEIDDAEYPGEV